MTGLPRVTIVQTNGQLGGTLPSTDGESLFWIDPAGGANITPTWNYSPINGKIYYSYPEALVDVEQCADNLFVKALVARQFEDFFRAGGSKLHVLVTTNWTTVASKDIFDSYIRNQAGAISLVGVLQYPRTAATLSNGVDQNILNLKDHLAEVFVEEHYPDGRPFHAFVGGFINTNLATLENARGTATFNSGQDAVTMIAMHDRDFSETLLARIIAPSPAETAIITAEPMIGYCLGLAASITVERNIGEVALGALKKITKIYDTAANNMGNYPKAKLDAIYDKGYLFARRIPNLAGLYICDFPTCVPLTDDFSYGNRCRVRNKAVKIAHRIFNQKLLSTVSTDVSSGKLSTLTIKGHEYELESGISAEMVPNNIQAVNAVIDPNQDVIATGSIIVQFNIIPFGEGRYYTIKAGLRKTNT